MRAISPLALVDRVVVSVERLRELHKKLSESVDAALVGKWSVPEQKRYEMTRDEITEVLVSLPPINGFRLQNTLPEYGAIVEAAKQSPAFFRRSGPAFDLIAIPEVELARYERQLRRERHRILREEIGDIDREVREIAASILSQASGLEDYAPVSDEALKPLRETVQRFASLLEGNARLPNEWADLMRHLRFRQVNDIQNIESSDWPKIYQAVQAQLELAEPLPVGIEDLGTLGNSSTNQVAQQTQIAWNRLDAEQFEQCCADLLNGLLGWENVKWLTRTNASDRGRDIEAHVVCAHPLVGTLRHRVIVQCKHFPDSTVSARDIDSLDNLVHTHPRTEFVLIITSGKFSDQVTQIVDRWNERSSTQFELWDRWRLGNEVARVGGLAEKYRLR